MLGTTLWLLVATVLLATALLDAGAALARASVHAAAAHAAESAMHDALADYQNRLGAAIAADDPSDAAAGYSAALAALPNPLSRTFALGSDGAPSNAPSVAYDVVPTTVVAPGCAGAAATSSSPDAIGWLQCGGDVAESRVSLRIDVRVLDPSAAVLVQRAQYVTLRVFAQAPYSAVVGRKDGDAAAPIDANGAPAHEGDLGGDTVSGAPAVAAASPWPASGTLIHVRYECHDGAGSCANAAPPDPDAGLRANARWQNGNAPPP